MKDPKNFIHEMKKKKNQSTAFWFGLSAFETS